MTFQKLYEEIGQMTPEQRQRPAVIAMQLTGEVAEVIALRRIADFNDTQLPDQLTIWYDRHLDPAIF